MAKLGDLGCRVGDRIVKAYDARAKDKRGAQGHLPDPCPQAFLAESGWSPENP